MKKITLFVFAFFIISVISAQHCDRAFSAANYSVSHTNKAYESNNTEHVREWTEKAMETFSEVEQITADCGCDAVSELAYQGYEACDRAQGENLYERSHFFAKRAKEKAKAMIIALSKCTNIPLSDIEARRNVGGEPLASENSYDASTVQNDLDVQQEELLRKQQELIEQQKILKKQLEDQAKQVAVLKQQRASELIQQKRIKVNAEVALAEIQKNFEKLATALNCPEALKAARISFIHTIGALEKESLGDTKSYYTLKLNEIIDKFNVSFSECASSW